MVTNIILGYDCRVASNDKSSTELWPADRRKQYLIRPEIELPMAVDRTVWPSLFYFGSEWRSGNIPTILIEPTDFHQQSLRLWKSLTELQKTIGSESGMLRPHSVICFTIERPDLPPNDDWWKMAFEEPTEPSILDSTWTLLGFDVGDKYFTSGLSNCGYQAEAMEAARRTWGGAINGNGLFSQFEAAQQFRHFVGKQISSHTPFYVFGIYRIPR